MNLKRITSYIILALIIVLSLFLRVNSYNTAKLPLEPEKLIERWPDESIYYKNSRVIHERGITVYLKSEAALETAIGNSLYLSFFDNIKAAREFNIFLSMLTIIVAFLIAKIIFSDFHGLAAAFIFSVYRPFIMYSYTILTEPLFIFVFALTLLIYIAAVKNGTYIYYGLSGILVGICISIRPNMMLFGGFIIAISSIRYLYDKSRVHIVNAMIIFIFSMSVVLPLFVSNKVNFGEFKMANGGGAALYLGSRIDTQGDDPPYRGKAYDIEKITEGKSHLSSEGDKALFDAGKKNALNNIASYMYICFRKLFRLITGNKFSWFYPKDNIFSYGAVNKMRENFTVIFNIIAAVFVALAGSLSLFKNIKNRKIEALAHFLVYSIIFSVPFLVIQRYGLPVFLILLILSTDTLYYCGNLVMYNLTLKDMYKAKLDKRINIAIFILSIVGFIYLFSILGILSI